MKLQKMNRLVLGTIVIPSVALLMACGSEATAIPPGQVSILASPEPTCVAAEDVQQRKNRKGPSEGDQVGQTRIADGVARGS